jgi:hypothetical protein
VKIVLGISGYAQAGKDTFADAIESAIGKKYRCSRFKFAEPLRRSTQLALEYLNIKVSPWTENKSEKNKLRPLLISLGEYARSENENVFADLAAISIKDSFNNGTEIAMITDLRYSNESKVVKKMCDDNGYEYHRIHIVRNGNPPAGEVEERSVASLLDDGIDVQYVANDGDINTIHLFATEYANRLREKCMS